MKNCKRLAALALAAVLSLAPVLPAYAEDLGQLSNEDYSNMADLIKNQIEQGNLDSSEDIQKAIDAAEEEYGIEISDSDKEKAVKILDTVNDLGIDKDKLADIVDDVYSNVIEGKEYDNTEDMVEAIEDQIIDSATDKVKEVVKENVKHSFSDYFRTFLDRINEFFAKIKSLWAR